MNKTRILESKPARVASVPRARTVQKEIYDKQFFFDFIVEVSHTGVSGIVKSLIFWSH